jgi:hypothetical protein
MKPHVQAATQNPTKNCPTTSTDTSETTLKNKLQLSTVPFVPPLVRPGEIAANGYPGGRGIQAHKNTVAGTGEHH